MHWARSTTRRCSRTASAWGTPGSFTLPSSVRVLFRCWVSRSLRVRCCAVCVCLRCATGHGGNVQGVETITTYDKARSLSFAHRPGRAEVLDRQPPVRCCLSFFQFVYRCVSLFCCVEHGQWTACFAQLIVDGVNHGVHVFIVRIRNSDGTTCPST